MTAVLWWVAVSIAAAALLGLIVALAGTPQAPSADVSRLDELDGICPGCGRVHTHTPPPPDWRW